MNLFATHLKLTPYYKSTILQLKKKEKNEKQGRLTSWRKGEHTHTPKPPALRKTRILP